MLLSSVPMLRRKKGTEKLAPVTCAHAAAEEGYREACPCHLCPCCGGRRAQRSLPLSPVPMLRRKKGHSEACSCHLCPRCDGRRVQEGVRRITAKIKTVICEQAPNHGSYFAYARLIARVNSQFCKGLWCYTILNPFAFRHISTSSGSAVCRIMTGVEESRLKDR